jgi:hypothetical protein
MRNCILYRAYYFYETFILEAYLISDLNALLSRIKLVRELILPSCISGSTDWLPYYLYRSWIAP